MAKRNKSTAIPIKDLQDYIVTSLSTSVSKLSNTEEKPLLIDLVKPRPVKLRIYAFNCGNPPGGRPVNEYKIVLNVGQNYGDKGNFDYSDGYFPIVLGYVNSYDVFVLWDASKHKDFAYNKNMQVKSDTILTALAENISSQVRRTNNGPERILAARSEYLLDAIYKRIDLLYDEMTEATYEP